MDDEGKARNKNKALNLRLIIFAYCFILLGGISTVFIELQLRQNVRENCESIADGRLALRTFVKAHATPLKVVPGATPSLAEQVLARNDKYVRERDAFLRAYPRIDCEKL